MTERTTDRRGSLARLMTVLFVLGLAPAASKAQRTDLRTLELVRFDCRSEIGGRELTLFANGTTRVRLRVGEETEMLLKEMSPGELDGYLNRLRDVDLSEAESGSGSVTGDWVESCVLTLDLDAAAIDTEDAAQAMSYSLSRFDSLSLSLSHAVGIAEEIFAWARDTIVVGDFPRNYRPAPGDILRRRDGLLFEVIAYTSDQRGVELWGVDQPLVIYVLATEIVGEFVEIVETN